MNAEALLSGVGGSFNVRLFGAKGDGVTDDTTAIQSAIDAALAQPSGTPCIVVPAGRYRIDSYAANGYARLSLDNTHGGKIHIRGEGDATLFTTTRTPSPTAYNTDALLAIWGPTYANVVVENLNFERRSSLSDQQVNAISFWGTPGTIVRPRIIGCTFTDFPQAIELTNTSGALITGCRWRYSDGAACGRGNAVGVPNVGIRCDKCQDTQIVDNYWVGTERTIEPNASWPMDGLCWGVSRGWTIRGNIIRRAWNEAIYAFADVGGDLLSSSIIEGNTIDCDYPDALKAVALGAVRVGIRADDCNLVITGNHIRKVRQGVVVYNYQQPGIHSGGVVSLNNIVFDEADQSGIGINVEYHDDLVVCSNRVYFPPNHVGTDASPACGVFVATCAELKVLSNVVARAAAPAPSAVSPVGVFMMGTNDGAIVTANIIQRLWSDVKADTAVNPNSLIAANVSVGVAKPVANQPILPAQVS
jgi:hypothetical protein